MKADFDSTAYPTQQWFTGTGWRVLICDDDVDVRRELAQRLKDQGFSVLKAPSGKRALAYVRTKKVDVAVIDLNMPNIDGISTIERIQSSKNDIRIIVLSARDNAQYRQRALDRGLRIERWVDKSVDYLAACTFAVLDAVSSILENDIRNSVDALAHSARLTPDQVISIRAWLRTCYLRMPEGMTIAERPAIVVDAVSKSIRDLDEVLHEIDRSIRECFRGYDDPALRQFAWDAIRRTVAEELWASVSTTQNRYKHQLAVQLKLSVLRIEAPQLTIKHLEASATGIQRLRSQNVDADDVAQCERLWEDSNISILPSFEQILEDWERFYPSEELSCEPNEGFARIDDPDPSNYK